LVMQFADDRHVRVYGGNSLYHQVLQRLGIPNAWHREVNAWGYRLIGLHELAEVEGRIVIVEPTPLGTLERVGSSSLWRRWPVVERHPPVVLPPEWSLGGMPSVQRFARLVEQKVCLP